MLDALAETLTSARRYGEAMAVVRRAMDITAREYPVSHPLYVERKEKLTRLQQLLGNQAESRTTVPVAH